jgi:hypothetical protein
VLRKAHRALHLSFSLLLLDPGIAATFHLMIYKINAHQEEQIL